MQPPGTLRARAAAGLITATVIAVLGLLLQSPGASENSVVQASYDLLHRISGTHQPMSSPVLLVYLDLDSYFSTRQDPAQPWSRDLHAQLVQRLTRAGARAIVFDVVFSGPSASEPSDRALAESFQTNGRVILGAELSASSHNPADSAWTKSLKLSLPYEPFLKAAAGWGLASLHTDDDFVVRRYFPGFTDQNQPSVTWATARFLRLPSSRSNAANARWVHYYGPPMTIPYVSYASALNPADAPDEMFRDKIVFIGARPFVEGFKERRDELRSPYRPWRDNHLFMPAVEIHATELLNLIRGDWLERPSARAEAGILLAVALVLGAGLMWFRPVAATSTALASAAMTVIAALWFFQRGHWFPWLIISGVQIPTALGSSILFNSLEWYRTRRRMEAAKRLADAKIREQAALIDKAHDAILVQTLDGRTIYANPSAEHLYGWSTAELQRDAAAVKLFGADSAIVATARSVVLAKGDWSGELRQQTRAGKTITVDARWTLIRDESNRPSALLMINNDITDRKQLEAQFLRTQRMETIGSITGGMAHDLNNALSPVLLGVQLLRRKSEDEDSTRILGLMETSTQRGADMVRQVLLFARGKEGDFERVDVGGLLKDMAKMARETFPKSITIESFVPADLHPVRGNVTQLHQVLLNLCVNARDAMPEGGRISLVADNVELSPEEAREGPDATTREFVSLSVSDTGSGMSAEVRARIFDAFFTTKAEGKGTGLGLATVQRIVKNHGGIVRVESEIRHGTTFEVLLPRAMDDSTRDAAPAPEKISRGRNELLMVVDDERAIRELLAEGLAADGYRVVTASNGLEALERFQKHSREVRLAITDAAMPVMDGVQLMSELRKRRHDLPIIVASGDAEPPSATDAHMSHVRKPFTLDDVLSAVEGLLSKSA